ncbi:phenylacetate--CoA ligase family protein [Pelosinus sp. sgz500959]|uniref:phenylacetate--CoA ligase family protein n=1 Tax=Pelosinus sp. sgz500959 TaxID=3242472 RepID=UPI0036730086
MFWNQEVETLPRADMVRWQSHKLNKVIERVYEKSLLYSKRMSDNGISPEDIETVDDLCKLPFTTRQDLAANYPYGLLTMPVSGVSYIHKNQNLENHPVAMNYTSNDMLMWTELMARMLVAGGVNVTTVFQVGVPGELHPGSLGVCYGARQVGATLVPGNSDHAAQQLSIIEDFGVNGIFSTPESLLALAKETRAAGSQPEELPLQMIFCSIQSLEEHTLQQIKKEYGRQLIRIYGFNDIFGMGIGGECHCADGLHLQEDCFFPEIIDPESGQVLASGEMGELVLTSLTLEAMPMIRYRTGVQGALDGSPCACGRTLVRLKNKESKK